MQNDFVLTEAERGLLLELLEREQKQLLVEMRHTHAAGYRDRLRDRLALVESLLVHWTVNTTGATAAAASGL